MSEYWKSTPKYWCKHCKTFVRDTKPERTNHEATPKHQGNIRRFIRDLHRGNEREERDKQRAKDEVDRLNGVVSGSPSASDSNRPPWQRKTAIPSIPNGARQATQAERKQQLAQLAAMGVAVPEDFRREMAMAGDWQTVSEGLVHEDVKKEEDGKDVKPSPADIGPATVNIGVRKRKHEGQEEEEEAGERVAKKGWGSTTRTYPGTHEDVDLDALLAGSKTSPNTAESQPSPITKLADASADHANPVASADHGLLPAMPHVKSEASDSPLAVHPAHEEPSRNTEEPSAGIVFKKRKPKQIRQK
ncbi:MAG: hypothetical protein Q9191_005396 [Dirinaria sp. TL-2023a]